MRHIFTGMLLLLAGCALPASPAQITSSLQRNYVNRPANEFFHDYGFSFGEFELPNGVHVYRWASVQPEKPEGYPVSRYHSARGDYQIVDTYQGIVGRQYCELRIYTDTEDTIQRFAVAVDSMGKWGASRCSEIFSPRT